MPVYRTRNDNFFSKWTPEMAYVLGFIAADGNLNVGRRGNHYLELTSCDRDLMERVRGALDSEHKISERTRENNWQTSYRLQIGSKNIFNNLAKLGIFPNKSKTIKLPRVPEKYLSHFVRGYFDGDGSVTISIYKRASRKNKKYRTIISGFTSGSEEFLSCLQSALKKYAGIKGGTLYYHKGYRLYFSVNDTLALYRFLYKTNSNLYLARKREVFERYFCVS